MIMKIKLPDTMVAFDRFATRKLKRSGWLIVDAKWFAIDYALAAVRLDRRRRAKVAKAPKRKAKR